MPVTYKPYHQRLFSQPEDTALQASCSHYRDDFLMRCPPCNPISGLLFSFAPAPPASLAFLYPCTLVPNVAEVFMEHHYILLEGKNNGRQVGAIFKRTDQPESRAVGHPLQTL
eukprot:1133711-Pelagomonas_calceolata.AAC.1